MIILGDEQTIKNLMMVKSEIENDVKGYEAIAKGKREELARINKLIELNMDILRSIENKDFEWAEKRIDWLPKKETAK